MYLADEHAIQVSFETFRRQFHDCEMIGIRSPRSDMCDTCTEFKTSIANTETESILSQLSRAFQDYLLQAKMAQLDYNQSKSLSGVTHLSFDFSQNLVLPCFQDQPLELYFLSLLNVSLFGIHNETRSRQLNYIYREDQGKKGSNNVASMLVDYIHRLPKSEIKHLILFADNCAGQNKNNTIVKLLCWLCLTNVCETITLKFMIKGHTKFLPDSCFGHNKKKYAAQNVFGIEQIKEIISDSSTVNECIIFPSRRFKDYRSKLDNFFQRYFRHCTVPCLFLSIKCTRSSHGEEFC
eukprot:NODE_99_length_20944_cov_0.552746.p4 type:complete len:294 gc:universal NODE_99_length_20944_cov_0.552746:8306-7425(-)